MIAEIDAINFVFLFSTFSQVTGLTREFPWNQQTCWRSMLISFEILLPPQAFQKLPCGATKNAAGKKSSSNLLDLCINQLQRCPSPPGNRGAFAYVVSPGGGAFAILSWPRGLGISIPRGRSSGIWHTCFRTTDKFIGKDEAFAKDWLVPSGTRKTSMFLKVCFLNFRYFFIACKHTNISDKVN